MTNNISVSTTFYCGETKSLVGFSYIITKYDKIVIKLVSRSNVEFPNNIIVCWNNVFTLFYKIRFIQVLSVRKFFPRMLDEISNQI